MAEVELTAYAFNGGEISPAMQARVDYQKYATGAAKLLNMIPRPTGGAWRRPGTRFVAKAVHSNKPTRLIPFRFSVKQSYVLEFGDHVMRVIMDDGLVTYPAGHAKAGQVVTIATPYAAADLQGIWRAQTADVMFMGHPRYPIQRLARYDHHDWRFTAWALGTQTVAAPTGLAITVDGKTGKRYAVTAVTAAGDESYSSNVAQCGTASGVGIPVPVYDSLNIQQCHDLWAGYGAAWPAEWDVWSHNGFWLCENRGAQGSLGFLRDCLGYTSWFYEKNNGYATLSLTRPDGGRVTYPYNTAADDGYWRSEAIYGMNQGWGGILAAMRQRIREYVEAVNAGAAVTGKTNLVWNAAPGAAHYRVYREETVENKGAMFCRIGETAATSLYDDLLPYNPSLGMLGGTINFASPGNFPGAIAIFEQRLVVGRTDNQPCGFWGSRTGSFDNFTKHSPLQEDDSYAYVLDSREVNEIAWMVPMNSLLIGTAGSEWRAGGSGVPLSPVNPDVHVQSNFGCAIMEPLVVGRSVVFAGRSRRVLRDFQYSLDSDGFDGEPLTVLVEHLFADRFIENMCYQQEPESIVWMTMSDGALLSCTYMPTQNVTAWARHSTQGRFEGCVSLVDIDGSDRIYFSAMRTVNGAAERFIEVIDMPITPPEEVRDCFYVDCGLTYRGAATSRIGGLTHLEGMAVQVLADGVVVDGVTVRGGAFTLPAPASVVHVGLSYTAELETLDLEPIMQGGGTIRHRPRSIVEVTPTLMKTINGELAIVSKFQTEEPDWTPIRWQTAEDNPAQPKHFTGEARVLPNPPKRNNTTRVAMRCNLPTPFAVLGVVAKGDIGDV